jgi:hypothetical protein
MNPDNAKHFVIGIHGFYIQLQNHFTTILRSLQTTEKCNFSQH